MNSNYRGYITRLIEAARDAVESKAYRIDFHVYHRHTSIKESIAACKVKGINAIIAELKFASPSMGKIRDRSDVRGIVREMEEGRAAALSILTQPNYFNGSLEVLLNARIATDLPLLMKDIVVSEEQIDAAYYAGADAILLIHSVFTSGHLDRTLDYMIDKAHGYGLEVILEVHDEHELYDAIDTEADMIGINNRDLDNMSIDIDTTVRLSSKLGDRKGKYILSESGIYSKEHIACLKGYADAFLVGTSIMSSDNIKSKVSELVMA